MSGGFIHDDDFDKGNYNPPIDQNAYDQKHVSLSVLGHKINPQVFLATEGQRHALGWQRLIRESVDTQNDLKPYQAFDVLKIICHSFAFMMVAVTRCGGTFAEEYFNKSGGVGISLDLQINDGYRVFTIGSILRNIAKRGGIDSEVIDSWQTMSDIDSYMQTAIRPEKPKQKISTRQTGTLSEYLASVVGDKPRLSFLMADGTVLNGYLVATKGGYGVLKRSDSTSPYEVDLQRVSIVQTTTKPTKVLFVVA